jgi:hypothetical protein
MGYIRRIKRVYDDHFDHVGSLIEDLKKLKSALESSNEAETQNAMKELTDEIRRLMDSLDEGRRELVNAA